MEWVIEPFVGRMKQVASRGLYPFQLEPRAALQQLEQWNGGARIEFAMVLYDTLGLVLAALYREREESFVITDGSEQDLLQTQTRPITVQ